jgi:uncharacterized alkaline shock family protein YloU
MADKKGEEPKLTTLDSDAQGTVRIFEEVVENIAGIAAREVAGVHELGKGGFSRVAKAFGSDSPARGVKVEVGKKEVALDLDLIVEYGHKIQEVCTGVRARVTESVLHMTGLKVKELNINVVGIHFPEQEKEKPTPRVQ